MLTAISVLSISLTALAMFSFVQRRALRELASTLAQVRAICEVGFMRVENQIREIRVALSDVRHSQAVHGQALSSILAQLDSVIVGIREMRSAALVVRENMNGTHIESECE